ncbi:tetratricopeptide repeat protein [bacterium]|nr:tetratricopeptide repeat protein [bacterium]
MRKNTKNLTFIAFILIVSSCGGSSETVTPTVVKSHAPKDELNELLGLTAKKDSVRKVAVVKKDTVQTTNVVKNLPVNPIDSLLQVIDHLQDEVNGLRIIVEERSLLIDSMRAELSIKDEWLKSGGFKKTLMADTSRKSMDSVKTKKTVAEKKAVKKNTTADPVKKKFDDGVALMKKKSYQKAIAVFEKIIGESSDHALADDSQFQIAECAYLSGDYHQAIVDYQKVFAFGQSDKNASAQLKIGLSYFALNNKPKAKEELEKVIRSYGDSEPAKMAKEYLSKL